MLVRWEMVTEITKLADVIDVSEPSVALIVYVPAVSSVRSLNAATPLEASCMSVPPSTPPVAPVAMAIVTPDESVVTTLPN